jgi:hypothetical protein
MLKEDGAGGEVPTITQKREQLRASPAARELVAFMVSGEYAALVEGG